MKTLLVPTDFSLVAKNAFSLALELAQQWGAEVKLIHIYQGSFNTTSPMVVGAGKNHHQVLCSWLDEFAASVPGGADVAREVLQGLPESRIVELSKNAPGQWIVMGATGEHDWVGKLFGSVSEQVSRSAHCPVLLIPRDAKKIVFRKILYASNYQGVQGVLLDKLSALATEFQASVFFVHVASDQAPENYNLIKQQITDHLLQSEAPGFSFQICQVESDSVAEGLRDYAQEQDVDLLVMVPRNRSFWDRILQHSQTRKLALSTIKPLLVLHSEDL